VLTARFNAGFLALRTVSAERLLVRASLYQAGVRVATVALRFDPLQRRAHISWLIVTPTGRGGPTSRHLLQNLLLIERDCGITRMTLQAGLTHGGYVWAVTASCPRRTPHGRSSRRDWRQSLPPWPRISRRPRGSGRRASAVCRSARLASHRSARHAFGSATLGKHLLMGESWPGELDLSDEASSVIYMRRIGLIP